MKDNFKRLVLFSRIILVITYPLLLLMFFTYESLLLTFTEDIAYVEIYNELKYQDYVDHIEGGPLVFPTENIDFDELGEYIVSYQLKKSIIVRYFDLKVSVYHNFYSHDMLQSI